MKLRVRPLANAVNSALQPSSSPGAPAHAHCQSGFSLLEVAITLGVVTLLSAGVYTVFRPASVLASVQNQSQMLGQLRSSVNQAYSNQSSFTGVSTSVGSEQGWLPAPLQHAGDWGLVSLAAVTNVNPDDSWSATFPSVPSADCQKVAIGQLNNWDQVTVNQNPVTDAQTAITNCALASNVVAFVNYGSPNKSSSAVNIDSGLGDHCSIYAFGQRPVDCPAPAHSIPPAPGMPMPPTPAPGTPPPVLPPTGGDGGLPAPTPAPGSPAPTPAPPAPPAPAPVYPVCTVPDPQSQILGCPGTETGAITQTRTATCPTPTAPYVWGAWVTTSNTCAPLCVLPTPSTQTQAVACPTGQVSSIAPYGSLGITQSRTATCPTGGSTYVWGSWTNTGSSCTPACVAPAPVITPHSQTASCLTGRVTPAGASTFTQTNTQTTTYSCASPIGTATPSAAPATPWSPLESAACAAKCVVPATQYQTIACPAGQLSSVSPYSSLGITQSRTGVCPSPTGAGGYNAWTTTSNTCVAACVPPPPNVATTSCAGFNGSPAGATYGGTWVARSDATCTTPVGPISWSPVYAQSSACYINNACVVPSPATTNRQPSYYAGSCPGGQSLSPGNSSATWRTYTVQTYSCPSPYGPAALSAPSWDGTGGTYYSGCAPSCIAPATQSTPVTQTVNLSAPCVVDGYKTWDQDQSAVKTTTYSCAAPTGPYTANVTYTPWVNVGAKYNIDTEFCVNCVSVDAYVRCRRDGIVRDMVAGNVREGDELQLMNPGTGAKRWGKVTYSKTTPAKSVVISTESGITLTCSEGAPIGLADGTQRLAGDLDDRCVVAVDNQGIVGQDRVVSVREIGEIMVQHITCENDYFLAGDQVNRYLAHHNKKVGYCVSTAAFMLTRREGVEQDILARDVREGDEIRSMDPVTGRLRWSRVSYSNTTVADAVKFETTSGLTLTCSTMAPIGLSNGKAVVSVNLEGHELGLHVNGDYSRDRVVSVLSLGEIEVQHIDCEGFFLVGDKKGHYAAHQG